LYYKISTCGVLLLYSFSFLYAFISFSTHYCWYQLWCSYIAWILYWLEIPWPYLPWLLLGRVYTKLVKDKRTPPPIKKQTNKTKQNKTKQYKANKNKTEDILIKRSQIWKLDSIEIPYRTWYKRNKRNSFFISWRLTNILLSTRVAQKRSLDLTTLTSLSPMWCGFAPGFVNYKNGTLDSQPQVIKLTSCFPMVGGSLRVFRLPPPLKLVAMI
jgi:hypothetical protein